MTEIWRSGEGVPDGWMRVVKQRVAGASAGAIDLYMQAPAGKLIRSKTDLMAYLAREGITHLTVDMFDFSKKTLPREIQSAPLPQGAGGTPTKIGRPKNKSDEPRSEPKPKKIASATIATGVVKKIKDKPTPLVSKTEKVSKKEISPYDFLLEHYTDSDWKFMMAAFFVEVHGRQETPELRQTLEAFFKRFPNPMELHNSGWIHVSSYLQGRGYEESFARHLTAYTFDYVANQQQAKENRSKAHEISGSTFYANYCYRIFMLKDFQLEKNLDYDASVYRDWYMNKRRVQALLADV